MTKNVEKIIKFFFSVAFCTIVAAGMPQVARAAEEIAIDETNFPDKIFREYVKNFDTNNSNGLSEGEIANVKTIRVCGKGIFSLKGIEHFTALTELYCYSNQLTSLNVSKNTALTKLYCHYNQLTSLNISKNTELKSLYCYSNQLTSLDANGATALESLSCHYNQLTNLNISKNTELKSLYCYSNQLTSLDVNGATALESLYCYSNQLTSLNVSKNTELKSLYCYSNQLTSLDVNGATTLKSLSCSCNQLTNLNVSKNTALTDLYCYSNQLISLNVSKNTALTDLYCYSNQLTSLDANGATELKSLYCFENQLTSLDVSKNTALTDLYCSENKLTELKLHSQTYDKLSLYKGYLHGDINLSDLQNITEAAINNTNTVSLLKVIDITKPAIYKVNGKDFTIIYADTVITSASPSAAPSVTPSIVPSNAHIFSDYDYTTPVTGSAIIYGNGMNKKIDGKRFNNKALTVYTDIIASYKHTPNSNGTVKSSIGKVIVAVTKTNAKPEVNSKNKVTDTSAANIAKAKIKNGQITVTAVGKEGGSVYLWVIDTGTKGVSACCPIDVKLAPKKLEVQSTTGTKLTNPKIQNGTTLDVHITGLAGSVKTEDCTYTPTVDSKYQSYVQIVPKGTIGQDFTITAKGLKNDKNTKAAITFICDQNGKKVTFSLTITK